MPRSGFWKERQTEFGKYQQQFRDLKAHWYVSGQTWWLQCGESSKGILNPPQQALDVFKAITRTIVAGWTEIRAEIASKPYPRVAANAEPWEVWLDFMRIREWGYCVTGHARCNEHEWDAGVKDGKALNAVRKELKYRTGDEDKILYRRLPDGSLKRLSAKELKGKGSGDLQRYYHWLEDGMIEHVFESSARFCEELAARAFESEAAVVSGRSGENQAVHPSLEETQQDRARRRQAVVMPILSQKRWTRGRLVTEAAVGKNSVYEYLDGRRKSITTGNRDAIADTLGIKREKLPE